MLAADIGPPGDSHEAHDPLFNGSWRISETAEYARFQRITTRETIDLQHADGLALMNDMAGPFGYHPRLPVSAPDFR